MNVSQLYQFNFSLYQRPFSKPLITHHGLWEIREGIIIKLTNHLGQIGEGEIAPLSWFGSETLTEALAFCQQLPTTISTTQILAIPDHLPACQFAFASAVLDFQVSDLPQFTLTNFSALLPSGRLALTLLPELYQQGYRTFKWKIAVHSYSEEMTIFAELIKDLPTDVTLRLDANGGLTWVTAKAWLSVLKDLSNIQFLEQPLPVSEFDLMLKLGELYPTPLALDESVANLSQVKMCYDRGWRDFLVIKPAIMGDPSVLLQFCERDDIKLVFSTVFETEIGRKAAFRLAEKLINLGKCDRVLGFGVNHFWEK